MERLQKVIANRGLTSRRKAEELIAKGKVRVNGEIAKLGMKVNPSDIIEVNGKILQEAEPKRYYILNKPRGVITSTSDEAGRKTVLDYVSSDVRIYPVGRLDYDTTGLIILTNDGDLANIIMHPSNKIRKTYIAKLEGLLEKEAIDKLKNGVYVEGRKVNIINFKIKSKDFTKNTCLIEITIAEGRNHIVKKIFENIGHPVIRLTRVAIDFLNTKELKSGEYRELTIKEVKRLYSLK